MKRTKSQFDEVTDKATKAIEDFIVDEEFSRKIADHYKDEVNRIYDKAVSELERVLQDPPAADDSNSILKKEDCKNTKDSPDSPPDDTGTTSPTTSALSSVDPLAAPIWVANPRQAVLDAHDNKL